MTYYPRSGKVRFRGLGVTGRLELCGYWDGEPPGFDTRGRSRPTTPFVGTARVPQCRRLRSTFQAAGSSWPMIQQ